MTPERVHKVIENLSCGGCDGLCGKCAQLIAAESLRELASARAQAMEECIKAICHLCYNGYALAVDAAGFRFHEAKAISPADRMYCRAHALWDLRTKALDESRLLPPPGKQGGAR